MSRRDLPSLTGLRFAAALAVFGFHIAWNTVWAPGPVATVVAWLLRGGAAGVSFFFVLSGFVLTWSARSDDPAREFWRRRLVRIFPSHAVTWAVVLGWLTLGGYAVSVGGSFAALFLVQAWSPVPHIVYAANVVSWSLSCEVLFYLLFPLLLPGLRRVRAEWLGGLAAGLVGSVIGVQLLLAVVPAATAYGFTFPPVRLLEFVLGMVLARLVAEERWAGPGVGLAGLLTVAALLLAPHVPEQLRSVAVTIGPIAVLIPAVARRDLAGGPSWWRSRTAVWLGELSFGFYLVHHVLIRALVTGPGWRNQPPAVALALTGLALVVSMALAYGLNRAVERPFMRHFGRARTAGKVVAGTGQGSGQHSRAPVWVDPG